MAFIFYAACRRIRTVKKSCDTITVKFACGIGKFTRENPLNVSLADFLCAFTIGFTGTGPCALRLVLTSRFAANQPSWLLEASSWKPPHE